MVKTLAEIDPQSDSVVANEIHEPDVIVEHIDDVYDLCTFRRAHKETPKSQVLVGRPSHLSFMDE